ncbi:DUF2891 domain-containing protein [Planctomycetes bacterium K23_9]|uniref:DUF2891 domain-containing protein n=1 Tax=Stieleria marina TaxID=1930275 RepID=A0A517P305_9BACT|nr:hypothetical protein K239x_57800 [Planctomycetes bacterium K23_9]
MNVELAISAATNGRSWLCLIAVLLFSGVNSAQESESAAKPALTEAQATTFARLALKGIAQEYPNKPSNVMDTADDVRSPQSMHPAFYGSFDWHSSVHGHWMLARLLKMHPDALIATEIRAALNSQLTAENLTQEAAYFAADHNKSFERMYGWAWLMQLVAELHDWDDSDARRWREHVRPLEEQITKRMNDYLPKLTFPIRTGVHADTGFAIGMLVDYARATSNTELEQLLVGKSKAFYRSDIDYPAHYEPSGHDFFSSGFNEADLMRRVLSKEEYVTWLDRFLPQLRTKTMGEMMRPVEVSDVTDGHLVHLAGLNLSRAWTMTGIARALPESDPRRQSLFSSAKQHADAGLKYVSSGHYEGEHWLATFAVYHLSQ